VGYGLSMWMKDLVYIGKRRGSGGEHILMLSLISSGQAMILGLYVPPLSLWLCSADVQLTASGDQTTRIHSLEGGSPRVTSTMRGHTSSVKTVTFFDPTRSHLDPSIASSIVASAGRDGNILLFDLRCQGRQSAADSPLPLTRPSYSNGVDGFCAQKDTQILEPVMTIRGAHGEGSRKTTINHHVCSAELIPMETKLMISERLCDQ
jgi:WD40 repeat protein